MVSLVGQLLSQFADNTPSYKVLIVGIDNSGKTTLLESIKKFGESEPAEIPHTIPTKGLNIGTTNYEGMVLTFWDVGGKKDIRKIWKQYLYKSNFILFAIDSSDPKRLPEAEEALRYVLEYEYSYNKPISVLLNKADLVDEKILEKMQIEIVQRHPSVNCFVTSALQKQSFWFLKGK